MLPTISTDFAGRGSGHPYDSAFWRTGTAWCSRGCDALQLVLRDAGITGNERVLVPSVHCPSIPNAIHAAGINTGFYPVNQDLTPVVDVVARMLGEGARALLLIHYFGFQQRTEPFRQLCDQHGALLIEDCAHTFFGLSGDVLPGQVGHYAIASTRKLFPLPDGGAAISASSTLDDTLLTPVPWLEEGRRLLRTLQQGADFGRLRYLSRPVSSVLGRVDRARRTRGAIPRSTVRPPSVPHHGTSAGAPLMRTSRVARLLMGMTDVSRLAKLRRRNYLALLDGVQGLDGCHALFPELPQNCVPYVFPLVLRNPAAAFPALKSRGVPIFRWEEMEGPACAVADRYETQLIQLPCHQELGPDDIAWLLTEIRNTTEVAPS